MQVVIWLTGSVFPAHRNKQLGERDLTPRLAWPFFTKPTHGEKVQLQVGALYVNGLYRKTELCTLVQYVQSQGLLRRERAAGEQAISSLPSIGLVSRLLHLLYCSNCRFRR